MCFNKVSIQFHNSDVMHSMPGKFLRFEATFEGDTIGMQCQANKTILLKPGCKVMLLWKVSGEGHLEPGIDKSCCRNHRLTQAEITVSEGEFTFVDNTEESDPSAVNMEVEEKAAAYFERGEPEDQERFPFSQNFRFVIPENFQFKWKGLFPPRNRASF